MKLMMGLEKDYQEETSYYVKKILVFVVFLF